MVENKLEKPEMQSKATLINEVVRLEKELMEAASILNGYERLLAAMLWRAEGNTLTVDYEALVELPTSITLHSEEDIPNHKLILKLTTEG